MFDLFGGSDDDHDDRVESQAVLLRNIGYSDIRADHTSGYPEPEKRNGRVLDVTADGPFGNDVVVEVDIGTNTSKRDQRQLDDLYAITVHDLGQCEWSEETGRSHSAAGNNVRATRRQG